MNKPMNERKKTSVQQTGVILAKVQNQKSFPLRHDHKLSILYLVGRWRIMVY
jgi:hypothetical protein